MGLIHHEIRRGTFRKPEAMEFICNFLKNAQNMYQLAAVVVIDM